MKTKITLFAAVALMTNLCFTAVQTAYAQCRDPWINNAYRELAGRAPSGTGEVGECNIKLYNNGTWNNYDELKRYVQEVRNNQVKIAFKDMGNGQFVMAVSQDGVTAVDFLRKDGSIVAAGGGYLIGNDSAGIGLVGPDGGTISVTRSTPGFSFSGNYSTLSGRKIRTSGRGGIKVQ